ncbi:hypothetical protein GEMRC1_008736 [Eukaryota sp. GEM-RC1]
MTSPSNFYSHVHSYSEPSSPFSSTPITKQCRKLTSSSDVLDKKLQDDPFTCHSSCFRHNISQWRLICSSWPKSIPKPSKFKQLIRQSIPPSMKGFFWFHLSGGHQMALSHSSNHYESLLDTEIVPARTQILKDIDRTFPDSSWFHQRDRLGRAVLYNVLSAFSSFNPTLGYTQGMAMIAGSLLRFQCETDAFYTFTSLMVNEKYHLEQLFIDGVPKVKRCVWVFDKLVANHLPLLSNHFKKECITTDLISTSWFLTLFLYSLPFSVCVDILDCFIYEGWKVIYRVALALLQINQQRLLTKEFSEIMISLQGDIPKNVDASELIRVAFSLKLKRKEIEILEKTFDKQRS